MVSNLGLLEFAKKGTNPIDPYKEWRAEMKRFLFCESTEGGMDTYEATVCDLHKIPDWMSESTKEEDLSLMKWMVEAQVGDYRKHRIGVMIRLRKENT